MTVKQFKRQLATIMSIDVDSYSVLMGVDEEHTVEQLSNHRQLVQNSVLKFGGRLFGVAGDSQMAEFTNPLEALRSAIDFQVTIARHNQSLEVKKRMQLRVGLNIGDVIVEDGDLYGDDVNISARLQENAHPGGIAVSQTIYSHVDGKIDASFEDDGPQYFKNIGTPIRLFHVQFDGVDQADRLALNKAVPSASVKQAISGLADRPALAVLPFEDHSASDDSQYIADGLSEDLAIGLAKLRWFPVIARGSSVVFRGKPVNEMTIGRTLGARYLLEGSVKLRGKDIRVTTQLVNANAGLNIWSNSYQYPIDSLFDLQDEIIHNIISVLSSQIDQAEQSRSYTKSYEKLDTWDLVKRASWHQNRLTRDDADRAYEILCEALERDPNSVDALVQMAWWNFLHVWTQQEDEEKLIDMEKLARWAMNMDIMDSRPHMLIGISWLMRRMAEKARGPLEEAVRLNPSLALAHASIGTTYILTGDGSKAIPPLKTAMRLNPVDLNCFHTLGELAIAHFIVGKLEDCFDYTERSLGLRPGYWYAHVVRIAALVEQGEQDSAAHEVEKLVARHPRLSVRDVRWIPIVDTTLMDRLVNGLVRAGFAGN